MPKHQLFRAIATSTKSKHAKVSKNSLLFIRNVEFLEVAHSHSTVCSPSTSRPRRCQPDLTPVYPLIGVYLGVVGSQGLQRRRRFFFSDYETTSFLDNGQHSFVLRLLIDKRKIRNSVVPTIHRLCPTCCLVVSWTSSLKELRSSDNSTGYRPPFVLRPLSLVRRNEALTHLKLHTELQHLRNKKWT